MFAKLRPWLSVIMGASLAALYLSGRVEGPVAPGLALALETSLLLWVLWGVFKSIRRFKGAETDPWKALEKALGDLVPAPVARVLVMEFRLWGALYAWMRRRSHGRDDFTYHARSPLGMFMGIAVLVTPLEIAVLELLIPWPWLRITLLVLALYALLWLIMLFASMRSLPHHVDDHGLHLRYGVLAGGFIPFERMAESFVALKSPSKSGDGLHVEGETAYLAINGETNLCVRLNEPVRLDKTLGETPPLREIHFWTDEPKRLIERLATPHDGRMVAP